MVCTPRPGNLGEEHTELFGVPSPDRIQQMAADIRKIWSSRTRARRAAEGLRRVELMVASAFEFGDSPTFCDD